MSEHREISAEELAVVFQLAAVYPDLRHIPEILADLESRCKTLTGLVVGQEVAPRNIDDLLKLLARKLVSEEWVKARLGILEVTAVEVEAPQVGNAAPMGNQSPTAQAAPSMAAPRPDPGYVIKDRRSVAA